MYALESKHMLKMSSNTHIKTQEVLCTGTDWSKSWSTTRPFKETAEKYSDSDVDFVVYRRENIYSSHAQKSPE